MQVSATSWLRAAARATPSAQGLRAPPLRRTVDATPKRAIPLLSRAVGGAFPGHGRREALAGGSSSAGPWGTWHAVAHEACHTSHPSLGSRRWASTSGAADPYKTLGIGQDASQDQIKSAYRKLALKWHPDRNPDNQEQANLQFKRISQAYAVLSDPKKRAQFDRFGVQDDGGGPRGFGGANAGRPMTQEEAAEMFKAMFGDKSLDEIIREVERATEHHLNQMKAKQEQLRQKAESLASEAEMLQMQSFNERRNPLRSAQLLLLAKRKAGEAAQAEQELQAATIQKLTQQSQARLALSNLRALDPKTQAENRIRRGLSWGAAIGAYFILGTSFVGSIFVFIGTSLGCRLAFGLLAAMQKGRA